MIKKFKNILLLSIIVILGLVLRLIFIDKPEGLWNDEYTSWAIASMPYGKDFWISIKSQCHMPFYYLYLKAFIKLGGNSDLFLRLTSVFAGLLSIISMYFVGRGRSVRTGMLCALITSLSGFLIYYSQEVRFYEILFFFSALTLMSTMHLAKDFNWKNLTLYIISAFLVMFTHTIGFVFIFFTLVYITLYQKKKMLPVWCGIGIILMPMVPLIYKIFNTKFFTQWWGHFTLSKLAFLLTDYFSPVLTNLTNAPDKFFYTDNKTILTFMTTPTVIAIFAMLREFKNKLWIIPFGTVFVMLLAAISGKLVFLTKYSIEIYPILIYLAVCGLLSIKNKWIKWLLVIAFCSMQFIYTFSPYSAQKIQRAEGHRIVANLLSHANLRKGDKILLQYYSQEKYAKYFDFSPYRVFSINKGNFNEYLDEKTDFQTAFKSGKNVYRNMFEEQSNPIMASKINNQIIGALNPGEKLSIVVLKSVAPYSQKSLQIIAADDLEYNEIPLLYLVFSYLYNETLNLATKKLTPVKYEDYGKWAVITFYKS